VHPLAIAPKHSAFVCFECSKFFIPVTQSSSPWNSISLHFEPKPSEQSCNRVLFLPTKIFDLGYKHIYRRHVCNYLLLLNNVYIKFDCAYFANGSEYCVDGAYTVTKLPVTLPFNYSNMISHQVVQQLTLAVLKTH